MICTITFKFQSVAQCLWCYSGFDRLLVMEGKRSGKLIMIYSMLLKKKVALCVTIPSK